MSGNAERKADIRLIAWMNMTLRTIHEGRENTKYIASISKCRLLHYSLNHQSLGHFNSASLILIPLPQSIRFLFTINTIMYIMPRTHKSHTLSLSHLLQQRRSHGKRLACQRIMRHDHRHPRMRTNIVQIRLRREPSTSCKIPYTCCFNASRVYVLKVLIVISLLLQCVEGVLKLLIVISLLGTLIVRLAHYVELFGGGLIILLEDVVEEDVQDLLLLLLMCVR